jgi:cytoskeletal protein CcmA (bactofilin family)
MKSKFTKILLFLAIILLPLGVAKALDTKTGNSIYIAKDEIVSGNLYAAGNTVTVDGTVSGDIIAAAQTINVNGRVEGDVIVVAQDININGEVGGNVRVAGNSISLDGLVARNANAFGSNIVLGTNSQIGWDVFTAGANFETRGNIGGGLSGSVGRGLVSGKIGKSVNLKMSENALNEGLTISPEASIGGELNYTAKKPAQISDKASIGGKIEQKIPQTKPTNWLAIWAWAKLYSIFSALVVGLVLVFLGRKITPKILEKIEAKPLHMLLPGLLIMFVLPPIALVLAFTIIGIPMALIVSAWWLVATYVAKIVTAILVGQLILKTLIKKSTPKLIWSLILGVTVSWLLFAIPFVGWLLGLFAIWLGLGGIWTYASNQFRNL